jgi:DNA-binding response OmpR family regulator
MMPVASEHVLVVEDDPEINELVGAFVRIAGYSYASALDGASALSKAGAEGTVLILLDIMLPDVDGFEVCRQLKGRLQTRHIPVVILTALDREEHIQRGRDCGAAAYLIKPFEPDRLIEVIQENAKAKGNGPDHHT